MKKYRVNEIFYSLQGEGRWAGRAACFVRFSGCNLKCPFCDTDFVAYEEMEGEEILQRLHALSVDCRMVVLTGGEPTLQVDEELIQLLHRGGYFITMETNGTRLVPKGVDWVTCSPKMAFVKNGTVVLQEASEVKVVFDNRQPISACNIKAQYYYVQPCDTGNENENAEILRATVKFVEEHPLWQLSLQLHKILHVR
jgi:7-carboxy-7-deazaguanine synthase